MRPEHLVGGGLAVAVVVLAIGWVCILWRRDGQRFRLMQLALEKGVSQFPNTPPFWLQSLRQGVTVLALGVALCGVGAGALLVVKDVPEPTPQEQMQAVEWMMQAQPRPTGRAGGPDQIDSQPPRLGEGAESPGPQPGPEADRGPGRQPPPPPIAMPAVENWHRAQAMRTIGMLSLACGAVLVILGVVRVAFSVLERGVADEQTRILPHR